MLILVLAMAVSAQIILGKNNELTVEKLKTNNGLHIGHYKLDKHTMKNITTIVTQSVIDNINCTACREKETRWECQEYGCIKKGEDFGCAVVSSTPNIPCKNNTGHCSGDADAYCYIDDVTSIDSLNGRTCITQYDKVYCWGELYVFNMGIKRYPTKIKSLNNCLKVSVHEHNVYCLTTDNKVLGVGFGQALGRGSLQQQTVTPLYVKGIGGVGDLQNIKDLFAISYGAIAIDFSDRAIGWGNRYIISGDLSYDYYAYYIPGINNSQPYLYDIVKTMSYTLEVLPSYVTALTSNGELLIWGSSNNFYNPISKYPQIVDTEVYDYAIYSGYTVVLKYNHTIIETTLSNVKYTYIANSEQLCGMTSTNGLYAILNDKTVMGIPPVPGLDDEEEISLIPYGKGVLSNITKCVYNYGNAYTLNTNGEVLAATTQEDGIIGDGTKGVKDSFTHITWNIGRK